jgi:hypothetical protein
MPPKALPPRFCVATQRHYQPYSVTNWTIFSFVHRSRQETMNSLALVHLPTLPLLIFPIMSMFVCAHLRWRSFFSFVFLSHTFIFVYISKSLFVHIGGHSSRHFFLFWDSYFSLGFFLRSRLRQRSTGDYIGWKTWEYSTHVLWDNRQFASFVQSSKSETTNSLALVHLTTSPLLIFVYISKILFVHIGCFEMLLFTGFFLASIMSIVDFDNGVQATISVGRRENT